MRLAVVDGGHAPAEAAVLDAMRARSGSEPTGVVKTLQYRPELFGRPFSDALERAMRGPSSGHRESGSSSPGSPRSSTAATSEQAHGAVASYALGEEMWDAVVADWRSAPLRPELDATLVFLEKMTLRPEELGPADAEAARAGGV